MKIRNYLDIFNNEKVWKILRIFVRFQGSYSGRQVAEMANINHSSAIQYLEHLASHRVLEKKIMGKAHFYSLRDNYFIRNVIKPIILQEYELYDQVKQRLRSKLGKYATAIIIYGSYSRGEETEFSDLDVCLIIPNESEALTNAIEEMSDYLREEFSLSFSPHIFTEERVKQNRDMEVLKEIKNQGDWIYGQKGKVILRLWLPNTPPKR